LNTSAAEGLEFESPWVHIRHNNPASAGFCAFVEAGAMSQRAGREQPRGGVAAESAEAGESCDHNLLEKYLHKELNTSAAEGLEFESPWIHPS
jgi:hypothetical protein